MVKASNRVGPAGGSLSVSAHAPGSFSAVISVRWVHAVQVHHVLRHHGLLTWARPAPQSKHVEKSKLKLVEEAFRLLWGLLPGFAVSPPADLGDKSGCTFQQHLSEQQYHERADHGDHDQSVPVEKVGFCQYTGAGVLTWGRHSRGFTAAHSKRCLLPSIQHDWVRGSWFKKKKTQKSEDTSRLWSRTERWRRWAWITSPPVIFPV